MTMIASVFQMFFASLYYVLSIVYRVAKTGDEAMLVASDTIGSELHKKIKSSKHQRGEYRKVLIEIQQNEREDLKKVFTPLDEEQEVKAIK